MNYILSPNIALRSWQKVPFAYYRKESPYADRLTEEEFDTLLLCDGNTDLPESDIIESLTGRGLILAAEEGETLSPWQEHRFCDNRYMPKMNLQITAKCNYNCIHCFNAADNAPLMSEMSYDDILKLLDSCAECGINAFTVTGGEPMCHRNFLDIVKAIYERGMYIAELNTNGFYINQYILDEFKKIGCRPKIKISFDGLEYHDWMRGSKGAEERALRAISLCIENGFYVYVQYNINRRNTPTLIKSLDLLEKLGVKTVRLIRTTYAPRWEQNAPDLSLSLEEYYDLGLELAQRYRWEEHTMKLIIWQVIRLIPRRKEYAIVPVRQSCASYSPAMPICPVIRSKISVGANGNVYPCMQMSGFIDQHGIVLGNVFTDGLKNILQDGRYLDFVCSTVQSRIDQKGKCSACPYLKSCSGGCPAFGLHDTGGSSFLAPDDTKCFFYENGYYEKFVSVMNGWNNLTEI